MRPSRSLLYVPGNRQKMLDKAPTLPADALILDLEDSVPVAEKPTARTMVHDYIPTVSGKGVWVRANSVASGFIAEDLDAIVGPALDGIFLPKPESPDDVREVDRMLTKLESERGVPVGKIEIIIQIESALNVIQAFELVTAAKRVASLNCGTAENGDLQTDMGCAYSIDGPELMYARQHVLMACRAARKDYPIDGVFAGIKDEAGYARDTELSMRLGYRGRTVIHPNQIEPANRLYSPAPEEVAYYRRLLGAFDEAVAAGAASVTFEGKMIDYAMAANARRVIALADLLGAPAGA